VKVTAVYLWLDGCDPAALEEARLAALLDEAVRAGAFELLYSHTSSSAGRIVALAVVGESHIVLHAEPAARKLCGEVLSCTTREAAAAAIEVVRRSVTHGRSTDSWVEYEIERGFNDWLEDKD